MPAPTDLPPEDLFRRMTFYSVLGGLCPIIPIPFVDDWALEWVRRRMISEIAREQALNLTSRELHVLAKESTPNLGCVGKVFWGIRQVVGAVLGKLFRSVFYFLTLRRSVHRAAETFHIGYLVRHAIRMGERGLPRTGVIEAQARAVSNAVSATVTEVDARPIYITLARDFRRSLSLLMQAAAVFRRFLPRRRRRSAVPDELPGEGDVLKKEEEILADLVDRVAASLWGNQEYFANLERVFEGKLAGSPGS